MKYQNTAHVTKNGKEKNFKLSTLAMGGMATRMAVGLNLSLKWISLVSVEKLNRGTQGLNYSKSNHSPLTIGRRF